MSVNRADIQEQAGTDGDVDRQTSQTRWERTPTKARDASDSGSAPGGEYPSAATGQSSVSRSPVPASPAPARIDLDALPSRTVLIERLLALIPEEDRAEGLALAIGISLTEGPSDRHVYCAACGYEPIEVPAIAKCDVCGSRQMRRG